MRGQILSVREWDFVMAARSLGVQDRNIMFKHILPHVLAPLLVAATFGVAGAILTEAGLSFLGLGVLPPTPSWGNMLNGAQSIYILERHWWIWLPPGMGDPAHCAGHQLCGRWSARRLRPPHDARLAAFPVPTIDIRLDQTGHRPRATQSD